MNIAEKIFLVLAAGISISYGGEMPFSRGVNLTTWFQESNVRKIQFSKYTKKDFENIKLLGCDVIRLPINMHAMTKGAPDFQIEPLLFDFLDHAVDWAEELNLHLILDNHSFDAVNITSPFIIDTLVPVWKQIAQHMKNRSALVYYEVLNEPHGISDIVWNAIQKIVIDSIRSVDKFHTIIVGPASWNSYYNLAAMPTYADTNLIYTFHFYDPFILTHQGASWTGPSLEPLKGVPFPYDAARMPLLPPAFVGTWIQSEFNNYPVNGTVAHVKSLIDIAVNFKNSRNVRLLCGEFGIYIPNSMNADRIAWYEPVRKYFEEKGIAWTTWDYQGGFGLFEKGTDELFDYDLNIPLVNALGLTAPTQKVFTVVPDSAGFDLYTDYVGSRIISLNYTSGDDIDFYSTNSPVEGKYCMRWTGAQQYQFIAFDFVPTQDLSQLKNKGYGLEFSVRSSSPGLQFDIRFIDTKTGPADHPWRMRKTVTASTAPWDGAWHHVRIPLAEFAEHGAYDSIWYNPAGLFNWKAIDRFDIVAEESNLNGKEVWFDDIRVSALPSQVADAELAVPDAFALFQNYPNPFNPSTHFQFAVSQQSVVKLQIFDMLGREIETVVNEQKSPGTYSVEWNASGLPSGVYFYRMAAGDFVQTNRLLLLK